MPAGLTGRVLIGGEAVGRGYLASPGRTAERFIPDPFSGTPGARLYDTGDLGRYTPDGAIEFLGRNDHQLKINGVRLELGEIEAVLQAHPKIDCGAVHPHREESGAVKLIAYVVLRAGVTCTPKELRAWLSMKLTPQMMPHRYVFLEELPINAHGKLDRGKLRPPVEFRVGGDPITQDLLHQIEQLTADEVAILISEREQRR